MSENLVEKILKFHLIEGQLSLGETIAISVDQTLIHDATGTMVGLQFEAL
jgi:aconitate hydratase